MDYACSVASTVLVCLSGVLCCVGARPCLLDILRLVVPIIKEKWKEVGEALKVEHAVLNTVRYNEQREDGRALELLALWSQSAAGTGSLPRTWHSLLVAVETAIGPKARESIEADLHKQSPSSAFDENCQKIVSVCSHYCLVNIADDVCLCKPASDPKCWLCTHTPNILYIASLSC